MKWAAAAAVAVVGLLGSAHDSMGQTTVDGLAEVSVVNSATGTGGQSSTYNAVGQNYSLGWSSTLIDPRVVRYSLQGMFRTSNQNAGVTGADTQNGRSDDLGYKVGATLLPVSVMPLFVQVSRTRDTSAGELTPSNPLRSGLLPASGVPPSDFESVNHDMNIGWHLSAGRLPQVELSYRKADSVSTGGGYRASQTTDDLSGSIQKNTSTTHHVLRYQSLSSDNVLQQTFSQKLGLLDYDFGQAVGGKSRLTAHVGRHTTAARSVFETTVDPANGVYAPPVTTGESRADYGQVGFSFDPTTRFSLRADANVDRQTADAATTSSVLGSLSTHAELIRGLTLQTSGTAGDRQQIVGGTPITVSTRMVDAGAVYQVNSRWIGAGAAVTRGVGRNTTPEGQQGNTDRWAGDAHLSATVRHLSATGGFERSQYRDDILDFGNYSSERWRGAVQLQGRRATLSVDADRVLVSRGREETFVTNLQRTISGTATLRLPLQSYISATAGRFTNDYSSVTGPGADSSLFYSVGADATLTGRLHLSGWVRAEQASASRTQFSQNAVSAFSRLDYRLRTLNVAIELRQSRSRTQYPLVAGPDRFTGRQIRFSVSRQIGWRVR